MVKTKSLAIKQTLFLDSAKRNALYTNVVVCDQPKFEPRMILRTDARLEEIAPQ